MNLYALSFLVIFLVAITMAIFMFIKSNGRKTVIWWGYFCSLATLYGFAGFMGTITQTESTALFWMKLKYVSVLYVPIFFCIFVNEYLKLAQTPVIPISLALSIPFVLIFYFFERKFFGYLTLKFNQFYEIDPRYSINFLYLLFIAYYYVFLFLYSFVLLIKNFIKSRGAYRNQLKYLILGMAISFMAALSLFLMHLGILHIYPYPNFLIALFAIIIGYAILRHNLLDITIVFKKGLVYSVLVTVVTGGYLIFVLVIGRVFQGLVGYQSFVINLMAVFAIAVLFNPLRNWIQRVLDKRFFQGTLESLSQERQRLQQELFHAEKLAYVGQLASSIAHEIRNPLTAIKTYIEYFPKKHLDPAYQQKFQTLIPGEIERIERVVHQLLDLAKPRDMLRTDVSIQAVVNATLSLLEETMKLKNIRVHKDFQANDDVCLADEEQLKQAFLNLFLNAVQAMEENGVLTIETKGIGSLSKPHTLNPNPFIRITIKDTGIGIPKETLAQLFTPFQTTKKDGIGLGLVITKEIIEAHHGTIAVESRLDEGTTFIIQLPLKA